MSRDTLDVRRLLCPLPVIRVQDRVAALEEGDLLEVLCTDPGVLNDIPAWCRMNGHTIVETKQGPAEIVFIVRVGGENPEKTAGAV